MKNSLIILGFFAAGIVCGYFMQHTAAAGPAETLTRFALYALVFLVGLTIGGNAEAWRVLRTVKLEVILVPVCTIAGTLLGAGLATLLIADIGLRDGLAVGAGFGYYSLSSLVIRNLGFETLAVVALLSNILREIITLIGTPIMARYLGKLLPISVAGATSMDSTLPVITRFSGKSYAIIAVFNGLVLSILVPFLVVLILKTGS